MGGKGFEWGVVRLDWGRVVLRLTLGCRRVGR